MAKAKKTQTVDIDQLWVSYKANPTIELRNQLMEYYMPLVKFNAERVRARFPNEVEVDDLISSGYFGLMNAIDSFDLSREIKFETYCAARVQGAMLDEIRNLDWVPRLVRSRASKLNEATRQMEQKLGRTPTDDELANAMDISTEEVEKLKKETTTVGVVSLQYNWNGDGNERDSQEHDLIEDYRHEDPMVKMQRKDLIKLITKGLNQNERMILILYYYEEMTMKEIGATLDLSESRVSQMHSQLVRRLKQQLQARKAELMLS